jgi:dihydrofolate reductase
MIHIIVATDRNMAIGYQNKLLFWLPNDLKRFKELTTGNTIIMGKNTFLSLPKGALPNRRNIVLSTRKDASFPGAETYASLEEAIKACKEGEKIYIIGGASVYKEMLPFMDEILVTKVEADGNADVFFENLDKLENWEMVFEGEEMESNGFKFRFTTYKNTAVKSF